MNDITELLSPPAIIESVLDKAALVRLELEETISNVNKSAFDIGALFHKIKKDNLVPNGLSFEDYRDSLKIKKQRAEYLRRIFEVMEIVGIPREQFEPVGTSKLRFITSLDPKGIYKNPETGNETPIAVYIKGLVDKHLQFNLQHIMDTVNLIKGNVGDESFDKIVFSIKRSAKESAWDPAVEKAKAQIGSVSQDTDGNYQDASIGACAEVIAISYLNEVSE